MTSPGTNTRRSSSSSPRSAGMSLRLDPGLPFATGYEAGLRLAPACRKRGDQSRTAPRRDRHLPTAASGASRRMSPGHPADRVVERRRAVALTVTSVRSRVCRSRRSRSGWIAHQPRSRRTSTTRPGGGRRRSGRASSAGCAAAGAPRPRHVTATETPTRLFGTWAAARAAASQQGVEIPTAQARRHESPKRRGRVMNALVLHRVLPVLPDSTEEQQPGHACKPFRLTPRCQSNPLVIAARAVWKQLGHVAHTPTVGVRSDQEVRRLSGMLRGPHAAVAARALERTVRGDIDHRQQHAEGKSRAEHNRNGVCERRG